MFIVGLFLLVTLRVWPSILWPRCLRFGYYPFLVAHGSMFFLAQTSVTPPDSRVLSILCVCILDFGRFQTVSTVSFCHVIYQTMTTSDKTLHSVCIAYIVYSRWTDYSDDLVTSILTGLVFGKWVFWTTTTLRFELIGEAQQEWVWRKRNIF